MDAGPIIAVLDSRDQWHAQAVLAWPGLVRRCVTTEAALVEASHLLARGRGDHAVALEFLLANEVPILAPHMMLHEACFQIMRRWGAAMDYGDAVLVALAGRLGIHHIFTFDRRGFAEYRALHGRHFEIIPALT